MIWQDDVLQSKLRNPYKFTLPDCQSDKERLCNPRDCPTLTTYKMRTQEAAAHSVLVAAIHHHAKLTEQDKHCWHN
jgi:hypothetical protein